VYEANRSVFREVNERIRDISVERWAGPDPAGFLCECRDTACVEVLSLAVTEYDTIRSVPNRFVLLDGHESPDVEAVVARNNGYVIVERRLADAS
jgi:hypothetical protein